MSLNTTHPEAVSIHSSTGTSPGRLSVSTRDFRSWVGCLVPQILLLSLLAGCSGDTVEQEESAPAGITARTERELGPVRVTVELSPEAPRLSDEPTLTVTIRSEQGVDIEAPPFGGSVGDFVIRDFYEPLPEVDGSDEILRQIYTLEPETVGEATIAPVTVRFTDGHDDGDGKQHEVTTDELKVQVTSLLGDEAPDLSELKPAAPPVEIPVEHNWSWIWWSAGAVVAVSAVAFMFLRRRRSEQQEEVLPPRDRALQDLDALIRSDLSSRDVKLFYVELTAVVRRYIEDSTGIRAPEQTTEEFLREIADKTQFGPDEELRLAQFLVAADLVKFAGQTPGASDIQASQERAREFIVTPRQSEAEAAA